ncbi:MAG: amidohydrolase [Oscillospiraceae bacterium]|nr:amidohydrolase [Oscillospiraceae bacterium]
MKTRELAHAIADETIAYRRIVHQDPEPSLQEFRTTDRICAELDKLGVSYRRTEPTGVIAELKGTKAESDKIVMLRGDIDALEVEEKTGLPFASKNPGMMHACGHDTHNAMLLGAVKVLQKMQNEFAGTVRFVFQPAEEVCRGAHLMVEQGAMDGVGYAYGIHIFGSLPCGYVASMPGAAFAAASRYWIRVSGKSSHGSDPAHGVDAAVAGCAIVTALQTLVSREYEPTDALVVTVGQIHSGTRFNIIPGYCEIEGTVRTYSREIHENLDKSMTRIAKAVGEAYRCEVEVEYDKITGPCINDAEALEIGKGAVEKVAPGMYMTAAPTMGSEDFAGYTEVSPDQKCAFFMLGAAVDDPSQIYSQHHEKVMFKEDAMETGVALYAQVAIDALEKLNS